MRAAMNGLVSIPLNKKQRQLLRGARQARGLSQEALAQAVGCSKRTILRTEWGPLSPSPELLKRLCRKLGFKWSVEIIVHMEPVRRKRKKA